MSTLKSFIVLYNGQFIRAYEETEVDKVIAEKDAEIAELEDKLRHYPIMVEIIESYKLEIAGLKKACNNNLDWCLRTLKENRHHKYKRCLAMAKICDNEFNKFIHLRDGEWKKWKWHTRNRKWLELAEKFKEAK